MDIQILWINTEANEFGKVKHAIEIGTDKNANKFGIDTDANKVGIDTDAINCGTLRMIHICIEFCIKSK